MKVLQSLLITLFISTLGFSALSGNALAATEKKEVTAPADKAATSVKATADEKNSPAKAVKGIPKDVNINTADKEMLTLLPGIGPVTTNTI